MTAAIPRARAWLNEAIRQVEADANRSADTHLHVFPLPAEWAIDLYLKDESVHPTGSLKHRLARSLFLYALCNGWIARGHHDHRGVLGLDGGVRGLLRAAARAAVRRGDAAVDVAGEDRADRVPGRPLPPGRRPGIDLRRVPPAGRRRPAATTSTSSPTPSGPPTGAATTTSPSRSSASSHTSGTRCRPGWSWAPAPAVRRRRSAGTSATAASTPGSASSTRRTRRSSPAGPTTTPRATGSRLPDRGDRPAAGRAVLPADGGRLHDRGPRRARRSPPPAGARRSPAVRSAARPGTAMWGALRLVAAMRAAR